MSLTVSSVSSQWLAGDEAEDEAVAEEGDEAGAARGDDRQAVRLLATTPLFVQDLFFLFSEETFCEFQCFFWFFFSYFVH